MVPQPLVKFAVLSGSDSKPSKSILFSKIMLQYAYILSRRFGFVYKFVSTTDGEVGRLLPNGTWTGLVGMLHRAEADATIVIGLSEERFRVLDYTYPNSINPVTFLTRKPEYIPETATFIKPFSLEVWIVFCSCLVFMVFLMKVILLKKHPFTILMMYVYGIVAGQPLQIGPRRFSDFCLVSGLIMGVTFLVRSYNAVLSSFLTIPRLSGVRTIPELAKAVSEGRYFCTSLPGSYISTVLTESDNSNLKLIGESLKTNKGVPRVEDTFNTETLQGARAAFVHGRDIFPHLTRKYFVSEDAFFIVQLGMAMRKDFGFKAQFEKSSRYLWHFGLHNKFRNDAAFESQAFSSAYIKSNEEPRPLSMKDFEGIFYFLIAGHVLSVFILILEITIKNHFLAIPASFLKGYRAVYIYYSRFKN